MLTGRRMVVALAMALPLGACGDDTMQPERMLTLDESVALYRGLGVIFQDTTNLSEPTGPTSAVIDCPGGGEYRLDATGSEMGNALTIVATATPTACVVSADGISFTLDGNPSVAMEFGIEFVEEPAFNILFSGGATGNLRWSLPDGSGACEIDLVLNAGLSSEVFGEIEGTFDGTMCRHEVSLDAHELILIVNNSG